MNESNHEKLRELLRRAIPPVDDELKRDLWPSMLRKLDEQPIRLSGLDWALGALLPVWCILYPETILGLFYHL